MSAFAHLPKSIANRPEVRALSMTVVPCRPNTYHVVGGSKPHLVTVLKLTNAVQCDCTRAAYSTSCAHRLAVANYIAAQQQES